MPDIGQEYKKQIKELEQQVRLLKEQVDFLTRKLYGTKSEKTSALEIEGRCLFLMRLKPAPIRRRRSRIRWRPKSICAKENIPASGKN